MLRKGGLVRRSVVLVVLLSVFCVGLSTPESGFAGPLQPNATFDGSAATGGVAFSADAVAGFTGGNLRIDTSAANGQAVTVRAAYLYNTTSLNLSGTPPPTWQASLAGNPVTMSLLSGVDPSCCNLFPYRANVTSIVKPLVEVGKVSTIAASLIDSPVLSDGLALVVVFSSPGLDPRQSVAIIDGGQSGPAEITTAFGLASGLDIFPGFSAVLSLGISHGQQDNGPPGAGPHFCGTLSEPQFSIIKVNGTTLTSCAGGSDDATFGLGQITVGGVGDHTDNPSDPLCQPGPPPPGRQPCSVLDDELYDITSFLRNGDTQVQITTSNHSGTIPLTGDDSIFLGILQLTAAINQVCTVGVNCPPPCTGADCLPPPCTGADCPPPPCTGADCPPPPPRVPGPATLILLGAGLLALIAGSRLFRKR
jgi:hypothetical protein